MLPPAGIVRGAAGGIGCGMEQSGVFDGWENGRPKGGRVRLEKRRGATGAADADSLGSCGGHGGVFADKLKYGIWKDNSDICKIFTNLTVYFRFLER